MSQSSEGKEPTLRDWMRYISVGGAVKKVDTWKKQVAQILYHTSRVKPIEIEAIRSVLGRLGFPEGELLHRQTGEEYYDVAERAAPDLS